MEVEIILGRCPLCDRNMIKNENLEEHHLTPKSLKGKETLTLHKLCYQKIHTVFTERELQRKYNNIKDIRKHIEIQKFIKWAARKILNIISGVMILEL